MNTIRLLGRRVEHLGHTYALSLIEAQKGADGLWRVCVTPFERETASTPYHGGTVRVCDPDDPEQAYRLPKCRPPELLLL